MKSYDAVVIGSGCGMIIVDEALAHGLKVALVDKGPLGGTCPNLGCIPSKMLIFPADRILEIQEAGKLGIAAEITGVSFKLVMERMRRWVHQSQSEMRENILKLEHLDYYQGEGHFTADYTIEVGGEEIKGEKVFIASGSRPFIPPIKGLEDAGYLTNESLLALKERPESVIIIGGGYIGAEYGHFLAAMGTRVTILEMADRLIMVEEPEISELLRQALGRRMEIYTGTQVEGVGRASDGVRVVVKDKKSGAQQELTAEKLLVAVGRRSNADLLKVENTGVTTDERGFIKVNEYLETNKQNIFTVGDANGQQMFTHAANHQAAIAAHNALHNEKMKMDHSAIPHAVYTHPQIASVGLSEEKAKVKSKILVGQAQYSDTAGGEIMLEEAGFAKAIVEKGNGRILGFHIIGPQAPILIQEVVNAMTARGHIEEINDGIHIHPALSELIPAVLGNLEES